MGRHFKLLILDDNVMFEILQKPTIVNRFPFLRVAAEAVKSGMKSGVKCIPCGGGQAKDDPRLNYHGLRAAIAGMGPDDQEAFKVLVSADRIRVYWKDFRNVTNKATF